MANRPQGCQSAIMTADGEVVAKSANAINIPVYALVIACVGATAGDLIALRDGDETDSAVIEVSISAANGTQVIDLGRYGMNFKNGIYYTELAAAADKITTTVIFG